MAKKKIKKFLGYEGYVTFEEAARAQKDIAKLLKEHHPLTNYDRVYATGFTDPEREGFNTYRIVYLNDGVVIGQYYFKVITTRNQRSLVEKTQ